MDATLVQILTELYRKDQEVQRLNASLQALEDLAAKLKTENDKFKVAFATVTQAEYSEATNPDYIIKEFHSGEK